MFKPTFVIGTETIVEAMWSVRWDGGNWLGVLFRDSPETPWMFKHRFWHYDDGAGGRRTTHEVVTQGETQMIRDVMVITIDGMVDTLQKLTNGQVEMVRTAGDTQAAVDWLMNRSWLRDSIRREHHAENGPE